MQKKLPFILIGMFLALVSIQVSVSYFINREGGKKIHQSLPNSTSVYTLPRVTVSLSSSDKKPGSVRMTIELEIPTKELGKIETYQPLIMDRLHTTLKHLTIEEIRELPALKGFRDELLWQLNQVCRPIPIFEIRFRDLLVT